MGGKRPDFPNFRIANIPRLVGVVAGVADGQTVDRDREQVCDRVHFFDSLLLGSASISRGADSHGLKSRGFCNGFVTSKKGGRPPLSNRYSYKIDISQLERSKCQTPMLDYSQRKEIK